MQSLSAFAECRAREWRSRAAPHTQPALRQAGSKIAAAQGSKTTTAQGSGTTAVESSGTTAAERAGQGRPHHRGREADHSPRVDAVSAAPNQGVDDADGVREGGAAPYWGLEKDSETYKLVKAYYEDQQATDNAARGNDASTATEHAGGRGDNAIRGNDASAATEHAGGRGDDAERDDGACGIPLKGPHRWEREANHLPRVDAVSDAWYSAMSDICTDLHEGS